MRDFHVFSSLVLAAALLPVTGASLADPRPNSVPGNDESQVELQRLDRDRDGRLSRAEFVSARPELKRWWRRTDRASGEATERDTARPEVFDAWDVDGDNYLSAGELANAQMSENLRGRLNRDGPAGDRSLQKQSHPKQSTASDENAHEGDRREPDGSH